MNQERIMKTKMLIAIIIAVLAVIAACVFAGLYTEESKKVRQTYIIQYELNLKSAADEIDSYIENKTDYDLHYNMVLSDMGAARTLVFLIDGYTEQQKVINELHYCFVKYPQQMERKLSDASAALNDITQHLDKGYDEAREIIDSIDKKGE